MARQADWSCGEFKAMILVTSVSLKFREGRLFLPLSADYQGKLSKRSYSGSFQRREGRLNDCEVLNLLV
jgi:polyribonucleotide nucleotidyltransferase